MFGKSKFQVKKRDGFRYIDYNGRGDFDGATMVLLHGMFGGLSNYDPILNQLKEYSFFVPHIPLFDFTKADLTIPALAEWIFNRIEEQNISNPIVLGNSMGGHIALEYALQYPDHLSALILTGSSGLMENDLGSSRPKRYDREYIKERASLTFYNDIVDDTIIDEILDVLQDPEKLGRLLKIARSTHTYNMENKLGKIDHPTLLIWGENDKITPPEVAETFLEKLPNARLEWIKRCGHAPMMENPGQFAEIVKDFIKHLERESSRKNNQSHEKNYSQS